MGKEIHPSCREEMRIERLEALVLLALTTHILGLYINLPYSGAASGAVPDPRS